MPPFDDVGVPPTVIATYCLPAGGEDRRRRRRSVARLERQRTLPVAEVERAQDAVAAAGEAEPARGRRHAAALRLGRLELPDAPAGGDVDRADRAVVLPARELPGRSCRSRARGRRRRAAACAASASGVSCCCIRTHGRLGRGVEDVVRSPGRTTAGRVVEPADRGREDRHGLPGLGAADARRGRSPARARGAAARSARRRRTRRPPSSRPRRRAAVCPPTSCVVDERRLRDVVAPLVRGDQLPPPLQAAVAQVDGDERVRPRVRARAEAPGSRAASRSRCRSRPCSWSASIVTGVHTAPPPTIRESRRHDCRSGGIVQNGVGHAGLRSGVYAITKPRMPYSEPAAPMTSAPVRAHRARSSPSSRSSADASGTSCAIETSPSDARRRSGAARRSSCRAARGRAARRSRRGRGSRRCRSS